ncbi:MliC family protein [Moraxella sp. ZY210820]|uniref:MliC family protein n=1 Tax=unclassified Moraxella TaxID=2685852 RepID=UPI0027321116|nr:MliC family protein [Moraxella sp. ZY210820]WLF84761.1 MliC family protein [Moraxella sp. ZY210820]
MKSLLIAGTIASLALVGCTTSKSVTQPNNQATQHTTQKPVTSSVTQKFECQNGLTVHVTNLNDDKIQLNTQTYSATLTQVPSASGERYTATQGLYGYGGEWHQKGNQAHFSYKGVHGANGETTCNAVN